jgi:hypothetical protein
VNRRRKTSWLGPWLVALLFLAVTGVVLLRIKVAGPSSGNQSYAAGYWETDRWRADARTALAVADYLLSPDNPTPMTPLFATNHQSDDPADPLLSATNGTSVEVGNPS